MVTRSYNVFAAEQVIGYPIEVPDTAGDNWEQSHRSPQQLIPVQLSKVRMFQLMFQAAMKTKMYLSFN